MVPIKFLNKNAHPNPCTGYNYLGLILLSFFYFLEPAHAQIRQTELPSDFKGQALIALSDADMVASAYADGKLGPSAGLDELSIVSLSGKTKPTVIPVSNSVNGPPASVAVSPNGRFAIVIETQGKRPAERAGLTLNDLEKGRAISVIDLGSPDHPKIIQNIIGTQQRPVSVSFNFSGDKVVIAYDALQGKQKPLVVYRFISGKLINPSMPSIPGWVSADDVVTASFYKNDILAIVNIGHPALTFYKLTNNRTTEKLTMWGNSVRLDKAPFLVRFTADGKFALCNAMHFGPDVDISPRGTVLSIRIGSDNQRGMVMHRLISHAETSYEPEGMDVSPDGQWVVTSNLEKSWEPLTSIHQTFYSSLSLLHLDTAGRLRHIKDFSFSAILPETVVFDKSGKYIAVTCFDHYADMVPGGSIDFWRLSFDSFDPEAVELVKTGYSIPVRRGAHSMVLIR